jgi:hypothetical protein
VEEIQTYQRKWKEHVERMQDEIPPKLALKYQPVGKRNTGHPRKRWNDQFLEESRRIQAEKAYFLIVQEEEEKGRI